MSQQLQITGGAKVRSLEGVITGSTGVLGSLPINGANGIPQLDSNGKILVSQLPNSVMEYKGTWNVTTNTPYLVNGTGNTGDVYLVEGAATGGTSHDFGAGAITFYNGDQVIYSGSIWQRGAGSSGTVTSVAITESGDALTITGSPITNSGTINIGFAGTSAQYVAGNGALVTFPTITTEAQRLITEVYNETGATLTKGTVVYINGGHGNLPTIAKALATSDATSAQTYGVVQSDIGNNNNGYVVVIGSLTNLDTQAYANGTQLYLSSTTAGAWTSTKQYAPAHLVYVGIVTRSHPTQGVVEIKIQNGYELDELHNVSAQNPWQDDGLFYNYYTQLWENKPITSALGYTPVPNTRTLTINGVTYDLTANRTWTISTGISGSGTTNYISKWTGSTALGNSLIYDNGTNVGIGTASPTAKLSVAGTTAISGQLTLGDTITNGTYTYTLPGGTGVLALTSDLTIYVTLGTLQTITGTKIYSSLQYFDNNVYIKHGISGSSAGYTTLGASTSGLNINLASGTSNNSLLFASTSASNTYTFPNATGTIALTTDLSSYVPTSRTLTINGTTYDLSANRSWTISGSQWTTTGSDIYYNTGTVGIGTTTPTGLGTGYGTLDVRGSTGGGINMGNSTNSGYIYFDGALRLQTSASAITFLPSGSEKMRIASTGNVGIGTSSPSTDALLHLAQNTINLNLYLQNTNGSGKTWSLNSDNAGKFNIHDTTANRFTISSAGNIGIGTTSPSSYSGYTTLALNNATNGGVIDFQNNGTTVAQLTGNSSAFYIGTVYNAPDIFVTNSAERMRITSGGLVAIGTTSAIINESSLAAVSNGNTATFKSTLNGGNCLLLWNSSGTGNIAFFTGSSYTAAGTITSSGTVTSYNVTSDYRLKSDYKDYNALDLVSKIKTYDFAWNLDNKRMYGVIAHELQEVIPYSVQGEKDGKDMQGVDYSKLVPILVKAIQELKAEIDELKNK